MSQWRRHRRPAAAVARPPKLPRFVETAPTPEVGPRHYPVDSRTSLSLMTIPHAQGFQPSLGRTLPQKGFLALSMSWAYKSDSEIITDVSGHFGQIAWKGVLFALAVGANCHRAPGANSTGKAILIPSWLFSSTRGIREGKRATERRYRLGTKASPSQFQPHSA